MPKYILISFSLFLLLTTSCKKEEAPQINPPLDCSSAYTHLADGVKQINFKAGTYWIMYDSVSKMTDSLVVYSNNGPFLVAYPQNKGQMCQNKADRIDHGIDLYRYDTLGNVRKCTLDENYVIILGVEGNEVVIHGEPNYYPVATSSFFPILIYFDYYSTAAPHIPNSSVISKFDSISICNQYYKKVIKATRTKKGKSEYYFNVSTGFLKFHSIDSNGVELYNKVLVRNKILK